MKEGQENISLLLVDNDPEFHRIARTFERMGLKVRSVTGPDAARQALARELPDLLVLDLAAGGLQTLRWIQRQYSTLPAIVLEPHKGAAKAAKSLAADLVRFVSKPVNVDEFLAVMRGLISDEMEGDHVIEHRVRDLMVSPDLYPKVFEHEPVSKIVDVLEQGMFEGGEEDVRTRLRSALVYDKAGQFINIVRLNDILHFLVPPEMESPSLGLTGMFHARCMQLMNMKVGALVDDEVLYVEADAPIMEALMVMVREHQINLPVFDRDKLVGVIRDKDILIDLAGELGQK